MDVELQYLDGCPHWRAADRVLRAALERGGHRDVAVRYVQVGTPEQAEALGFRGSPTLLVDGRDLFDDPATTVGLSCRLYPTPDGLAGTPTLEQLIDALAPPSHA
jgi:hypothetical protein